MIDSPSPDAVVNVPPRWSVVPPGVSVPPGRQGIALHPGAGFGSGAHPTTRLCLQALASLAPAPEVPWQMLDFGSGSGILSIAGARLGATVSAVEIDEQAIVHAEQNVRLNGLEDRICHARDLEGAHGPYALVVANILRPVLLAFAPALVQRLAPGGALVLSGLVATDVPELSVRYASLLGEARPEAYAHGDWRALVWRRATPTGVC